MDINRRIAASICAETAASMVRTMPLSCAAPAMMLRAVPAWNSPTVSTAGESGFTSRLTIVWSCATR